MVHHPALMLACGLWIFWRIKTRERHCQALFRVLLWHLRPMKSMSNVLRESGLVSSATGDTAPLAAWQRRWRAQVANVSFHRQESWYDRGEPSFSRMGLIEAVLAPTEWNINGTNFRQRILQWGSRCTKEACLHQSTLEDFPKDCRRNFTRKSTKNSRPGGGLAGLGFLLLYT